VVVVRPPVGLATPAVYRACLPAQRPANIQPLAQALAAGKVSAVGDLLVNRLQAPAAALTDWIARLATEFDRLSGSNRPAHGHQMSGSGSSYFGLCRTARHARRQAAKLRARNLGVVFAAATAVG
jgi:4-diphosphocytidyl-2-C-methyl-D-erythritol kinase